MKVGINKSSYTLELKVPMNASEQQITKQINQATLAKIVPTYEVIKEQQVSN